MRGSRWEGPPTNSLWDTHPPVELGMGSSPGLLNTQPQCWSSGLSGRVCCLHIRHALHNAIIPGFSLSMLTTGWAKCRV